jgi:hypothetical protein
LCKICQTLTHIHNISISTHIYKHQYSFI